MLTTAIRIVAEWLASPTTGINATLYGVPREPDVPLPPIIAVYDETRHPEVARAQVPDQLPALLISTTATPLTAAAPMARPFPPDYLVDLAIRYATETADTAAAFNETALVHRAIMRALGQLWTTAAGEAARVRQQLQLVELRDLRVELYQSNDDSRSTAGVIVTVRVRDIYTNA